jgi:hypothetical protein
MRADLPEGWIVPEEEPRPAFDREPMRTNVRHTVVGGTGSERKDEGRTIMCSRFEQGPNRVVVPCEKGDGCHIGPFRADRREIDVGCHRVRSLVENEEVHVDSGFKHPLDVGGVAVRDGPDRPANEGVSDPLQIPFVLARPFLQASLQCADATALLGDSGSRALIGSQNVPRELAEIRCESGKQILRVCAQLIELHAQGDRIGRGFV